MPENYNFSILLIGLGSIGKRHLKNILNLGYRNVTVVTRTGRVDELFSGVKVFTTIEAASASDQFQAAIICTPTAQHIQDLQKLLAQNIPNIYLEKPAAHNKEALKYLSSVVISGKSRIIVGYDLHFDPGLQQVQQLIIEETVGKPLSINAAVGQYLPDWRSHEDYTKGMSASAASGGGVMLDLIHEFDYLYLLFGNVNSITVKP